MTYNDFVKEYRRLIGEIITSNNIEAEQAQAEKDLDALCNQYPKFERRYVVKGEQPT